MLGGSLTILDPIASRATSWPQNLNERFFSLDLGIAAYVACPHFLIAP
jgi:hypothetical protein